MFLLRHDQFVGKNVYQTAASLPLLSTNCDPILQTAPSLSAGLITMSVRLRKDVSASLSFFKEVSYSRLLAKIEAVNFGSTTVNVMV